ncbi:MAG: C1 family peptidase [Alphaproteobacteria bacterium]
MLFSKSRGRQGLLGCLLGVSIAVTGAIAPNAADAEGTGLVLEQPETYRSFPAVPAFRNFLPKKVDLSKYFPPAAHQGDQGSCVGFAVSYGLRSFYENRSRILAGLPPQKFSPSFVYNSVLSRPNDCRSGATVSSGLKFLKANGTVPYENFPYTPDVCEQPSETPLFDLASEYRINSWRRVPTKSADQLKGRLYYGDPVVVGMTMTAALNELEGDDIYNIVVDQNQPFQGHAVVLAGYDEERQAFKFFNSWGADWADGGFGWISYEALMSNIDSAFVIDVPETKIPVAETVEPAEPDTVAAVDPQAETDAEPVVEPKPAVEPEPEPEPVVEPEPEAETQPEPEAVADLSTQIRDTIGGFECFGLTRRLKDRKFDGLSGYVAQQEDLTALQTLISNHPDGAGATLDIDVRPWPQCEALSTFSSPLAAAQGLDVRVLSAGLEAQSTFHDEDELVIEVTAPDFDAYLYVTYLQAGGDAVHFVKGGGDTPVPANSVVKFGLDPKKPRFYVQPPFGDEMIVAIASRLPLFDEDFEIIEEERAYLTRFRKGILTSVGKRIIGNVAGKAVYLTTVE